MAQINITINDREVQRALAGLKSGVADLQPAFAQIGEYYVERVDRRFEQEGPGWKALSPKYKRWKSRQPRAIDKILQFSGLLRGSISYQESSTDVRIGSDKIYASRQEKERSFLTPDGNDDREFGDIVLEYLRRKADS